MTDTLTILRKDDAEFCKYVKGHPPKPVMGRIPYLMRTESVEVTSLQSLSQVLTKLESSTNKAVIRGEPLESGYSPVPRTKANFKSAPRHWCMLDIDDLDCPADKTDPNTKIAYAIEQLPKEFLQTNFYYHFSSSMGIKPGIRVHLWFWLDRPCSDEEMKAWLADAPVDLCLFNPVQLHLTANPLFIDGAVDPLPERSGLYTVEGWTDSVSPPVDLAERVLWQRRLHRTRKAAADGTYFAQDIIFDDETGRVVDGREQLMFTISNQCVQECLQQKLEVTEESLAAAIWKRFTEMADLSVRGGYEWSLDHARQKARDRIAQLESGEFSYTSRSRYTTLLPCAGDAQWPKLVDKTRGENLLNAGLDEFFIAVKAHETPQLALRITMGAGKTRRTAEKLQDYLSQTFGELVEVYVPRHDLAADWEEALSGTPNTEVVHVYPRTGGRLRNGEYEHEILCQRSAYVRELETKGYPVYQNACHNTDTGERCTYFDDCRYLSQFKTDSAPGNVVRIYTHQSLFLPRNEVEDHQHPDLIIVDESFVSAAVANLPELPSEDVTQAFRTSEKPELGNWIVECLRNNSGSIQYLRDKGVSVSNLEAVALTSGGPVADFKATTAALLEDNKQNQRLHQLREYLIAELKVDDLHAFQRLAWNEHKKRVVVCEKKRGRFTQNTPVLYLDATLDDSITRRFLPSANTLRIDIEQAAVVTQVYDRTGSNSSWNDDLKKESTNLPGCSYDPTDNDVAQLVTVLNTWADSGEHPLLVGHKELCDSLRKHPLIHKAVKIAHFQSLRGTNDYEDCSVVFITGRNQPSFDEVSVQTRAIFGDLANPFSNDAFEEGAEEAPYWLSERFSGSAAAMTVRAFNDEKAQRCFAQIREAETAQAIARLRLVHADYPKRVFLLSNLPVEMPVDHLLAFNDLMPNTLEQALLENRHVALSPQAYSRQFGVTLDNAKKIIKRSGADTPESLLRFMPTLAKASVMLATYKAGDKRKTEQKHLFTPTQFSGDIRGAVYTPPTLEEALVTIQSIWGDTEVTDLQLTPFCINTGGG